MSWAPKNSGKTSAGPGSAGTSEIEFVAHFISDSTVHAIMRNAKQTGKALGLLDEPDQANKGALLKNTEFQKDQRCLAQMLLTALMSGPSQDPPDSISAPAAQNSSQKRVPSTQQMKHIAGCKNSEAAAEMLTKLLGQGGSKPTATQPRGRAVHNEQPAIKRLADFVCDSLRGLTPGMAEDHLFLTVFIPDPELSRAVNCHGYHVKETEFCLPEGWKMLRDPGQLLGNTLPSAVVKHESDLKGTGVFAGRRINDKELVLIYLGELEMDSERRPLSRMVVKQTARNAEWKYCFGIESLRTCLEVGPALGPYANAPDKGTGERANCTLDRFREFECKDPKGTSFVGYPIYASKVIENGNPYLWDYPPNASHGRNYV